LRTYFSVDSRTGLAQYNNEKYLFSPSGGFGLPQLFSQQNRMRYAKWLTPAIEACLALYLILLIGLYPRSVNQCNNIATITLILGVALMILVPPDKKSVWQFGVFASAVLVFYFINLVAVYLTEYIPGIGYSNSKWVHLPGLLIALTTAISVRSRRSAARLLAVLLAAAGLWYLGELVSSFWRPVWIYNRYTGSRELPTILAMELLPLFALCLGCAALLKNRQWAFASILGAILFGALLFLTKTRFALITMAFVTIPSAFLIQNRFGKWRQRLVVALAWLLIVAPAIGFIWYHHASPKRKSLASLELRVTAWKIVLQIFEKSPCERAIIGYGRFSQTFDALAEHYDTDFNRIDKSLLVRGRYHHCHNVLLQTFLETGVLGLTSLVFIWAMAFYRAFSAWRRSREPAMISRVLAIALITIAFMSQMDYCLYAVPGFLCWFLTGLAFASGSETKNIP
jgi:hypothetical protein